MAETLAELVVLSTLHKETTVPMNWGRRNNGNGETWKNKSLFRLALNKAASDEIAIGIVSITRDAE